MKRILAAPVAFALATFLSVGCTPPQNSDTTWQITNVYVDPKTPSVMPAGATATMVFGDSTVTGETGCAPFQGRAKFDNVSEPTKVSFTDMNFREAKCTGSERFFHDALTTLLDGEFSFKRDRDELLLTKEPAGLDAPSIKLVAAH